MRRRTTLFGLLLGSVLAGCAAPPAEAPTRLRVLAYNIKHGLGMDAVIDLERIASVIRAQDPDVVTLQEVDEAGGRSGNIDQARVLGELCAMQHVFGAFMDYDGGRYGMALLSRHPIVESSNVLLPPGAEPRSALEARIRMAPSGRDVLVTGIHLYRSEPERLAQARTLVRRYENAPLPVILAGDFNSERGSKVMDLFGESWANPIKQGNRMTFPADAPVKEIDFMLVRAADGFDLRCMQVVAERVASDHRPILIEIELPARAR